MQTDIGVPSLPPPAPLIDEVKIQHVQQIRPVWVFVVLWCVRVCVCVGVGVSESQLLYQSIVQQPGNLKGHCARLVCLKVVLLLNHVTVGVIPPAVCYIANTAFGNPCSNVQVSTIVGNMQAEDEM